MDFASGEQTKPAYHAVNPKGRVPALVTEHGILTETIAILEYVVRTRMPEDPWAAAKVREVMTYIASTAHVNHAHKMRGHRWADDESSWDDMRRKVPQTMADAAAYLNDKVEGPYVMGERATIADCYLYTLCGWFSGDGVDIDAYPKLANFQRAFGMRPSVLKARQDGVLA